MYDARCFLNYSFQEMVSIDTSVFGYRKSFHILTLERPGGVVNDAV